MLNIEDWQLQLAKFDTALNVYEAEVVELGNEERELTFS